MAALEALADLLGGAAPSVAPLERVALPDSGALDLQTLPAVIGALLPDDAIVVDEAVTASVFIQQATMGAGEHDYLYLTGGAIGWGLPAATGAAVGAPGRPVVCLEADGSAMYTIQALWTMAREGLDVTTIIIANRSYAILEFEFQRVGASGDGAAAHALMDIGRPELDFTGMARSMGVPARRVDDVPGLGERVPRGDRGARPAPDRGGDGLMRAIVTGGGSGIGAATAALLRERGGSVAVLDRSGGDILCDVTDADGVPRAVDEAVRRLGGLDVRGQQRGHRRAGHRRGQRRRRVAAGLRRQRARDGAGGTRCAALPARVVVGRDRQHVLRRGDRGDPAPRALQRVEGRGDVPDAGDGRRPRP